MSASDNCVTCSRRAAPASAALHRCHQLQYPRPPATYPAPPQTNPLGPIYVRRNSRLAALLPLHQWVTAFPFSRAVASPGRPQTSSNPPAPARLLLPSRHLRPARDSYAAARLHISLQRLPPQIGPSRTPFHRAPGRAEPLLLHAPRLY